MPQATITFENEVITPEALALKLKVDPNFLLKELKEEKGIFEDSMQSETILAWDTVQRACERRGVEAIDGWENAKKTSLNPREKEILGYCVRFHADYADHIVETLQETIYHKESGSKLASFHQEISNSINSILERVQSATRKAPSTEDPSVFPKM